MNSRTVLSPSATAMTDTTDTPFLSALTAALPDLIVRTVINQYPDVLDRVLDLAALTDGTMRAEITDELRGYSFRAAGMRRDLVTHVALTLVRLVLIDYPAAVTEAMDRAQIGVDLRGCVLAELSNRFLAAPQPRAA